MYTAKWFLFTFQRHINIMFRFVLSSYLTIANIGMIFFSFYSVSANLCLSLGWKRNYAIILRKETSTQMKSNLVNKIHLHFSIIFCDFLLSFLITVQLNYFNHLRWCRVRDWAKACIKWTGHWWGSANVEIYWWLFKCSTRPIKLISSFLVILSLTSYSNVCTGTKVFIAIF
jgi:hypothetical protein